MKDLKLFTFFILLWFVSSFAQTGWKQITASASWAPRGEHSYVVYDDKMWIMKGLNSQKEYRKDIWYSTNGSSWTMVKEYELFNISNAFPTVVFKGEMYTLAGSTC